MTDTTKPDSEQHKDGLSSAYAWLARSARSGIPQVEHAARTMMAFYQGAEYQADSSATSDDGYSYTFTEPKGWINLMNPGQSWAKWTREQGPPTTKGWKVFGTPAAQAPKDPSVFDIMAQQVKDDLRPAVEIMRSQAPQAATPLPVVAAIALDARYREGYSSGWKDGRAALTLQAAPEAPIPMILHCPSCGVQHVDAPEAPASDDERTYEAMRLRRVVRALGMDKEVPENDADLRNCLFSVLGMIAGKLERASPAAITASTEMTAEQARAALKAMPLEAAVGMVKGATTASVCPTCHGNDKDAPCAYPGEGRPRAAKAGQ